jgi:hypothetical protein
METIKFKREYISFLGYVEKLTIYVENYYHYNHHTDEGGYSVIEKDIHPFILPLEEVWRVNLCDGTISLHKTKHSNFLLLISESFNNVYNCSTTVISLVKRNSLEFNPATPPCPAYDNVMVLKETLNNDK